MAMQPQYKPVNPFVGAVNGMFVGKSIYVSGKIHEGADKFAINLFCGPNTDDDIALHINPRFPAGQIVRNTRKDGAWEEEERDGPDFPFKQGDLFGITITCRLYGYEVMANHYRTYTVYKHRVPFNTVTHVGISQDCEILLVSSGIEGLDVPAHIVTNPELGNLEIPFHNIRGRSVVVVGKPTNGDGRFSFNFTNAKGNKVHFHFNPRLGQKQIVRNTDDGGWGKEERDLPTEFPFVQGVPFQVKITVERREFVVEINGLVALDYTKRLKGLKGIRNFRIDGDVEINKVTFY